MSDEDKKVEETTEEETLETKPEETTSEEDASKETTPEVEEPKVEDSPDYAKLYEEEVTRREKAEHKIVKLRAKKLEEEDEEDTEDEDIKSYVDKQLGKLKVQTLETQYDSAINSVSDDPNEKKLIKLYLEDNELSGDVMTQVAKAKAMANYQKVVKNMQEISLAKSVKTGGADSSSYAQPEDKVSKALSKLSKADRDYLKSKGLEKRYVEKFGN